jgi:hypothetical protein
MWLRLRSRFLLLIAGFHRRALARALSLIPLPWVTVSMFRKSTNLRIRWEQSQPIDPLASESNGELPSIEVLIPCIAKDAEIVSVVMASTATGIENPVEQVVILAPISDHYALTPVQGDGVKLLADEDQNLPRTLGAVEELVPTQRQGWVKQQVLKLAYVACSKSAGVLVLDADTILLRSRIWLDGHRQILAPSHEYHLPYMVHAERCLGPYGVDQGVSWVTHHQLMQPRIVRKLLSTILQRSGQSWRKTQDDNLDVDAALEVWVRLADYSFPSPISEYHTYGVFLRNSETESGVTSQWTNVSFSREEVHLELSKISQKFSSHLSASGHSYHTRGISSITDCR